MVFRDCLTTCHSEERSDDEPAVCWQHEKSRFLTPKKLGAWNDKGPASVRAAGSPSPSLRPVGVRRWKRPAGRARMAERLTDHPSALRHIERAAPPKLARSRDRPQQLP